MAMKTSELSKRPIRYGVFLTLEQAHVTWETLSDELKNKLGNFQNTPLQSALLTMDLMCIQLYQGIWFHSNYS